MTPQQFQKDLLNWFDQHGRKHLPWQQNKTPYRVWISEIMLQQTQVNTVIPYFERFMHNFPDVFTLAHATMDQVLHLWAGLGYYSRARNLHHSAKLIVEKYHGQFPNTLDTLQKLPGIGPSTAGAILSIAFNQPATILDGNVKRVLSRFHGITHPINEKEIEKTLWNLATSFTPKKRNADYTQAMMDLGATVCVRSNAKCDLCPFQINCIAHQNDMVALLPVKKITRKIPVKEATFLVIKKNDQVLLYKRPPSGIWGSLWSLPEVAGQPDKKTLRMFCKEQFKLQLKDYQLLKPFRHTFTHYHLDIFPIVIEIATCLKTMAENQQIWYNLRKPAALGLPKPIQLIMRTLTHDTPHLLRKIAKRS